MECPKCETQMVIITHEGITIDRCTGCGGIWFDANERESLLATANGARAVDTGDPKLGQQMNENDRINCPHCTTQMIRMVDNDRPDIHFEQCAACGGSFLDAGELRELKRVTLSRVLQRLLEL